MWKKHPGSERCFSGEGSFSCIKSRGQTARVQGTGSWEAPEKGPEKFEEAETTESAPSPTRIPPSPDSAAAQPPRRGAGAQGVHTHSLHSQIPILGRAQGHTCVSRAYPVREEGEAFGREGRENENEDGPGGFRESVTKVQTQP